jgi:hypothetical protein
MKLETFIKRKKEREEKKKKESFEKYRLAGLAVRQKNAEERRKEREAQKKKGGRPKKRGPKKKRKRKVVKVFKPRPTFDFKIISVSNGKQNGYVGTFMDIEHAYMKLKELEEDNKKIVFPKKSVNNKKIKEIKQEYLLLEKRKDGKLNNNLLRNEIGKLVEHKISNDKNNKWIIRDKIDKITEETFWVFGYNPSDRKSFEWIYENILESNIHSKYDVERITLYKNKILFQHDNEKCDIVFCKNVSDAIRFYNLLQEWVKNKKNKQTFFLGTFESCGEKKKNIEKKIIDVTGWDIKKIQRSTTRS